MNTKIPYVISKLFVQNNSADHVRMIQYELQIVCCEPHCLFFGCAFAAITDQRVAYSRCRLAEATGKNLWNYWLNNSCIIGNCQSKDLPALL